MLVRYTAQLLSALLKSCLCMIRPQERNIWRICFYLYFAFKFDASLPRHTPTAALRTSLHDRTVQLSSHRPQWPSKFWTWERIDDASHFGLALCKWLCSETCARALRLHLTTVSTKIWVSSLVFPSEISTT